MDHQPGHGGMIDLPGEPLRRLPTLYEVLCRQTRAPVDLFAFYVYMRDQQRSVDYLDFWLDVAQHLSLCRLFISQLHRSVLYETPDLDKAGSKRSSQLLEATAAGAVNDAGEGPAPRSIRESREQERRISAFLREDSASHHSGGHHSHKQSGESSASHDTQRTGTEQTGQRSRTNTGLTGMTGERPPRPSFMTSNLGDYSSSSPNEADSSEAHRVTREDLKASAEKVMITYLLPGSEREIILPNATVQGIQNAIEKEGRHDPELFDDAKEYVYQAMERDAFPGFLRSKALGNTVPLGLLIRLVIGLLALFGGFWTAFTLIFLNKSRATRCWTILPFSIGVYNLVAHQYTLDPLVALAGYSELIFGSFTKVEEPFVKVLLRKRAFAALTWIFLVTAALVVLFVFVPGKRL
ncbi:MAG: hypothetical protein Q9162_007022 [Coniocarpon cinnabarinum]